MARKKNGIRKGLPILTLIGIIAMGVFWYLFGGMMLLRYVLGAIIFATFTLGLIKLLNHWFGKKKLKWI